MLTRLLADEVDDFLATDYLKHPRIFRGTAQTVDRPDLAALLAGPAELQIIQEGVALVCERPRDLAGARALLERGGTLAFRDPGHHDDGLRELSRSLAADLHAWPNVHLYWSPPGGQGFGWHFDPEEVFIVQLEGEKEYRWRPERAELPTEEWMGSNRAPAGVHPAERTELLAPGDCLYLPSGQWHAARALSQPSLSLSFGMMPATWIDGLEYVRKHLLANPALRRRVAPLGRRSPLSDAQQLEEVKAGFSALAQEVAELVRQPSFALRFLADSAQTFAAQQPPRRIASRRRPQG